VTSRAAVGWGRGSRSRASGRSRRSRRNARRAASWLRSRLRPAAIRKTALVLVNAPQSVRLPPAVFQPVSSMLTAEADLSCCSSRAWGAASASPARWMIASTEPVESSSPNSWVWSCLWSFRVFGRVPTGLDRRPRVELSTLVRALELSERPVTERRNGPTGRRPRHQHLNWR
jgi:hypothetical protein